MIPTLARLKQPGNKGIRALLLAPTKELAEQIHREVQRLIEGRRFKVCLLSKKISSKAITNQVLVDTPKAFAQICPFVV